MNVRIKKKISFRITLDNVLGCLFRVWKEKQPKLEMCVLTYRVNSSEERHTEVKYGGNTMRALKTWPCCYQFSSKFE